mgnify:CR=1 FL=1
MKSLFVNIHCTETKVRENCFIIRNHNVCWLEVVIGSTSPMDCLQRLYHRLGKWHNLSSLRACKFKNLLQALLVSWHNIEACIDRVVWTLFLIKVCQGYDSIVNHSGNSHWTSLCSHCNKGLNFMCHYLSMKGKFDYIIRIMYFKHSSKASYADTGTHLMLLLNHLALEPLKAFKFTVDHL